MKRTLPIAAALLVLTAGFWSGFDVKLSFFDVDPLGADFAITWQVELEEQVRDYELMRKSPNSNDQFVKIHTQRPHGPNKAYQFVDDQIFKSGGSEQLDYRLEAVYLNGVRETLANESVNYTMTAVRRTWGSLKAMFQ